MMGRLGVPRVLTLAMALLGTVASTGAEPPTRPNVILMMADDMGWAAMDVVIRLGQDSNGNDVNHRGTPHWETPNLVSMASSGLVFSRMYSQSPVCSPTRASVLTGRSPERMGIPFANTGKLPNREVTLAEYASSLGYTTGHFGKWHLGVLTRDIHDANRGGRVGSHDIYSTPLNNGFAVQYSTESKVSTYNPGTSGLTKTTRYWKGPEQFVPLDAAELRGDDSAIIARETNAFIEKAAERGDPFLAVSWFHTPHKPTNTPGNADTNNLDAYRFAMEDLDAAVGEIRSKVQELGIVENTILLFTSDNGPEDGQDYNNEGLRDNKRELYEGGVRVPGVIEWQGQVAPGVTHTPMVTTDYLPTLLDIWGVGPVDARPLDGQSMAETIINDRDAARNKTIVFKSTNGHQSALGVEGRYKLISIDSGATWSLYDIVTDYGESSPIATRDSIGSANGDIKKVYNHLLAEYGSWAVSVAKSLSGDISGDYATRVELVENGKLMQRMPQSLQAGSVIGPGTQVYLERQYATLTERLVVDSGGSSGEYSTSDDAFLAAGRTVHSFLIHFDTPGDSQSGSLVITFADPILGVIGESALLSASDGLSFADPEFDQGASRGLEASDGWTVSDEGRTITFDRSAAPSSFDQVRVLTAASFDNRPPVVDARNADSEIDLRPRN